MARRQAAKHGGENDGNDGANIAGWQRRARAAWNALRGGDGASSPRVGDPVAGVATCPRVSAADLYDVESGLNLHGSAVRCAAPRAVFGAQG